MPKERKGYITEKNGRIIARITYTDNKRKRRELTRRAGDRREARKILKQLREEVTDTCARTLYWQGVLDINIARMVILDKSEFIVFTSVLG